MCISAYSVAPNIVKFVQAPSAFILPGSIYYDNVLVYVNELSHTDADNLFQGKIQMSAELTFSFNLRFTPVPGSHGSHLL